MSRFAILFIRYVAAIVVACVTSFFTFYVFLFLVARLLGVFSFFLFFPIAGFCGVFSGTLCLPRASRRSGSIVLLILGLAFYVQMLLRINIGRGEDNLFPFVWLLPLAVGGFGAVYFFRRQPPNN
jgi:hypothetical protein